MTKWILTWPSMAANLTKGQLDIRCLLMEIHTFIYKALLPLPTYRHTHPCHCTSFQTVSIVLWDLHTLAFLIISLILSPPFSLPPWVDLYTPLFVLWKECLEWTQLKILTLKVWRSKNYIPRGLSWQDYELQSQVSWSFQIFGEKK